MRWVFLAAVLMLAAFAAVRWFPEFFVGRWYGLPASVPISESEDGSQSEPEFERIDAARALRYLKEEGTYLLDVREPGEWEAARIPGAHLIPLGQLKQRWREIPRDARRIVVYCAVGGRSALACRYLRREHGFLQLSNLEGGVRDWTGPLEKGAVVP